MAVLSGQLALPEYEQRRADYLDCSWLPPRWDWVDPLKDIRAETLAIQSGFKSRTQAIGERGFDAAMVDAEIASDRDREALLGLAFTRGALPFCTNLGTFMNMNTPILDVRFFATDSGIEPVREWLKTLPASERRTIGEDIKTVQFG